MNDWQHGTRQSFFANTHISHIIMWWNSVEWVVSVVTHFQLEKFRRKTCSDTQQLLLPKHCVPIAWSFGGWGGGWGGEWLFSPCFSSFDCAVLCDWPSDNKHFHRWWQGRICRLYQLPARCRTVITKEIAVPWMNKCRMLLFIFYYTSQWWHDTYLLVHGVGSIFFTGPYRHRQS